MARRLKLARAGAAVVGVSVAMVVSALPAGADPATGKVEGGGVGGYNVNLEGRNHSLNTGLIGFRLSDGTKLKMYCVEINTSIDRRHEMVEQPWDKFPNADSPFHKNRDKINWVLHNGFPAASTDAITEAVGKLAAPVKFHHGLSQQEAVTATQAAVWHFSDGTKLRKDNPIPGQSEDTQADVVALYNYLTGEANKGIGNQPTPALEITPAEAKGKAGTLIGPFTVSTTGQITELTADLPDGVTITDKDSKELKAEDIKNGTELFLNVPKDAEDGSASFSLKGTAPLATGRLFVGKNYQAPDHTTQSLIVAQADKGKLSASAKGSWTAATTTTTPTTTTETTTTPTTTTTTEAAPAPQARNTGGLASTGASILVPVVIGLALVGAGVGALLLQRRRRRA